MLPFQVLLPSWLWSGIILWETCLAVLSYLLLVIAFANVEEQVKTTTDAQYLILVLLFAIKPDFVLRKK